MPPVYGTFFLKTSTPRNLRKNEWRLSSYSNPVAHTSSLQRRTQSRARTDHSQSGKKRFSRKIRPRPFLNAPTLGESARQLHHNTQDGKNLFQLFLYHSTFLLHSSPALNSSAHTQCPSSSKISPTNAKPSTPSSAYSRASSAIISISSSRATATRIASTSPVKKS